MKERYQKLLDLIKSKNGRLSELLAKESPTDDEKAEAKALDAELDGLDAEAKDLKGQLDKAGERESWLSDAVKPQMVAKGGEDPNARSTGSPNPGFKFEGQAGNEVVAIGPNGEKRSIDADGWCVSEKQWRAICEPSYKKSYLNWMRCEALGKATPDVDLKAMAEGTDTAGGFLVPPDMVARITMRSPHPSSILANIGMITTSRDRVMWPKFKYTTDDIFASGVRIAWTGESGPSAEDTNLQNWGQIDIPVHTGSFEIYAYRDLVEDAAFNLEQIVSQEAQNAYQLGLDDVVINGSGVGRPRGMITDTGAADGFPTLNVGNPVTAAKLIELVYGLPPQYAANAKFLCNRTNVFATLAQIADSTGHFLFGLTSLDKGVLGTARQEVLLGNPIIFSAFMANGGAAAKVGIFGDFSQAYMGVQRVGLSVEPIGPGDRELRRANQVGWYFRFRFGGKTNQDRAARVAVQS